MEKLRSLFLCGAHELVINLRVTLFVNGDKKERWTALNAAMALTPLFQFVSIHHGARAWFGEQKNKPSILGRYSNICQVFERRAADF